MTGLVRFDGVWLDDRRRCTWALCDVSFAARPAATVALVSAEHEGAVEGVFELLTGRRLTVHGRVELDGVDLREVDRVAHLRSLVVAHDVATGERRLVVAGTSFVASPTPATLDAADLVVRFDAGFASLPESVGARAG